MSFAGLTTFKANLDKVMASPAFRQADDSQRLRMGRALLNSKYGRGSFFGLGPVRELPDQECQTPDPKTGSYKV